MEFNFGLMAAQYALFVFSTVCHEAAHAWAANLGGDDTAARGGQTGLDPWPHIRREPIGMVVIPLIGIFGGGFIMGWASTPYDRRWALAYPKRAAAMALAGPMANLALVFCSAASMHLGIRAGVFGQADSIGFDHVILGLGGPWTHGLATLTSILFSLNLVLFFFNLIPLAPLDGASALGLLPGGGKISAFLARSQFRFLGLLAAFFLFPHVYGPLLTVCLNLLFPGSHYR